MSAAVRLLEAWLPDVQPAPRVQQFGSVAGVAPMRKHECPDCGGNGRDRFRRQCRRCEGRCWVAWDDYVDDEVGHADTALVSRERWVKCPSCEGDGSHRNGKTCGWCEGQGGEWHTPASTVQAASATSGRPADALTIAAAAGGAVTTTSLWNNGSFAALEAARRRLGRRASAVELHHEIVRVEGRVRVPSEIRDWDRRRRPTASGTGRWANGWAQGKRNERIRALSEGGLQGREIARYLGVSEATVSRALAA